MVHEVPPMGGVDLQLLIHQPVQIRVRSSTCHTPTVYDCRSTVTNLPRPSVLPLTTQSLSRS